MVVAVAVIAAVIAMIPSGTKTLQATVIQNPVIGENPGNASAFTFSKTYDVTIKVITNNDKVVSGATVMLIGAGVAESGITNSDGIVTFSIRPSLGENVNEDHIKMTVKANGFQDYTDEDAITVYRL
ncbi:MAG: hypothetical protein DRN12_02700 [Thermoplasmata archaeon]|nr:MAG: hypothetical protein DRN12_02700 [Thermoplasmata archaeon]